MAITTTADIDELIPMIYEKARKTILETPVMRNLVATFDIKSKAGNQLTIPKWGTVTAHSLTQGVDMANAQTLGTTGIVLTVSEAGAQTIVTDDDTEDASEDVIRRHGEILGEAIADKDDKDGLALFSGLSTVLGDGSADLAVTTQTAGMTLLRAKKVRGDYVEVIHPFTYHAFANAVLQNANYGTLQPAGTEIGRKFRAKDFLGISIYESYNIDDTGAVAKGAMFVKDCFARVDKRPLRIEKDRDPSLRAWELNATTRYQYGEVEDDHGICLYYKAVAPTV